MHKRTIGSAVAAATVLVVAMFGSVPAYAATEPPVDAPNVVVEAETQADEGQNSVTEVEQTAERAEVAETPAPEAVEPSPTPAPESEPTAPVEDETSGTDPPSESAKTPVSEAPVVAPKVMAAPMSTEPVHHASAITSVTVVRSDSAGNPVTGDFKVGDRIRLDATWSVPDSAKGGDTFSMTLPSEFARYTQGFTLPDANGNIVGNCSVSSGAAPVLTCTLTDYVNEKTDVAGTLWFLATLDGSTEEEGVSFNVDGTVIFVQIPGGINPNPGTGPGTPQPPQPYVPGNPSKSSSQGQNGVMSWTVAFPGNRVGSGDVVITDALTPQGANTQAHHNTDGKLTIQYRPGGLKPDGTATSWQNLTGWTGGWNAEGTGYSVTIPANLIDPGAGYRISYTTIPNETAYTGDKFSNTANVSGIELTRTQSWTVTGGGTGSGADLGTVNITKLGDDLPEGVTYTVEYTDGTRTEQLTLTPGVPAYTVRFPRGTVLTFEEINLPKVDGIMWGTPVWSSKQVTVKAGESIAITLTNTATVLVPSIDIEKWDLDPITGDRDTEEEAAVLDPKKSHRISFTITNTGNEPLVDVVVSDRLKDGVGEIPDLSCVFPDDSEGVRWDGPFEVDASFECHGTLPALGWEQTHVNEASVSGTGQFSGRIIHDEDLWHGKTPERPVPSIDIEKYDVDGNDADSSNEAVKLPDGTAKLVFTITNTGNEPLVDVVVSDVVVKGGVVENLDCTFPDDSTGVTWRGPFEVDASFECTATLSGVTPGTTHEDIASVTGFGQFTGDEVTDKDPYHGFRDPAPVPPTSLPPGLAITGGTFAGGAGVAGLILLLAGIGVLLGKRRRSVSAE